jgi:hypothetical protein
MLIAACNYLSTCRAMFLTYFLTHHILLVSTSPPCFITYLLSYSLVRRPSETLGFLNYERPFFSIDCLLTPFVNIFISRRSFSTSSSHLNLSLPLLLLPSGLLPNIFLNCPSLNHSYYMSNSFQSFFNTCYYA